MMEIGLVIALAVMLFPPKELPKLARMIARVYGSVRKTAEDFRSAILDDEDLREPIDEIKGVYEEARWEVRDAERRARQQLAKAQMEMRMATARRIQADREAKAQQQAEAPVAETAEAEAPEAEVAEAKLAGADGAALPEGSEPPNADLPAERAPTSPVAADVDEGSSDEGRVLEVLDPTAPVAGPDPRRIAQRRAATDAQPRQADPPKIAVAEDEDGEPREGVA